MRVLRRRGLGASAPLVRGLVWMGWGLLVVRSVPACASRVLWAEVLKSWGLSGMAAGCERSTRAVLDAWADAHRQAAHPTAERVRVVRVMR